MRSQRKNTYLPHPAEQNAKHVVGVKRSKNPIDSVVYIKKSVLNTMINHCQLDAPYEACRLLSGIREKNETLWEMRNIERTTTTLPWMLSKCLKSSNR